MALQTMPSGLLRVLRWLPGLGSHDSDLHAARSMLADAGVALVLPCDGCCVRR